MVNINCSVRIIGDIAKLKWYGLAPKGRSSDRTKEEIEKQKERIQNDPNTSSLHKEVLLSVFKPESKEERMSRQKPKEREAKGRKLTMAETEKFCDLIDLNFWIGDKYLTLTYEKEDVTIDEASTNFENWIKRMRERYGDFKYLGVRAFQQRGTIHFHLLANLPTIPRTELVDGTFKSIWGHGNVDIKRIYSRNPVDTRDRLKMYMVKNLREFKADERSFNKRLYLMSKNLEHPRIIKGSYEDIISELKTKYSDIKRLYAIRFDNEYLKYIQLMYLRLGGQNEESFKNSNFKIEEYE